MNILYLPLEFGRWYSAKKSAYPVGVGMIEGFGSDVKQLTIPLMYHEDLWLKYIKELVGGQKFDQVWLEVVHSIVPEDTLEWLASIAPIRVGFIIESLTMAPEEFKDNPVGTNRRISNLNTKLPYLTHAAVCDTRDLYKFTIPTFLFGATVPERLIKTPNSTNDKAMFCGTLYGDRSQWVKDLIVNPPSPEDSSNFPHIFEQLFALKCDLDCYNTFFQNWYYIRQAVYSLWINHLHTFPSCAMVNLPHRTNIASSRVIEGMAAGKPVISQWLDNDADANFEDRKNIMYYRDLADLTNCIDELREDPDLRFRIAEEARINVLENYTTEVLVKRILEFVQT